MTTRYAEFLDEAGWDGAAVSALAGDASNRKYLRVRTAGRCAVLMDAAPERGEDTGPFLRICAFLRSAGLHAPEIYAADPASGLVLLEDLGDALFARIFETAPGHQAELYGAAVDVLVRLHGAGLPDGTSPDYTAGPMADAARLAPVWYAGTPGHADGLRAEILAALDTLDWSRKVLVLRDYHSENLLWLDRARGLDRVGLIDFQDAAIGHPVYDVISVMQDARRDVPSSVAQGMAARFRQGAGMPEAEFAQAAAVLGAQRALRILGVFARLSLHYAKPGYVDLIPRVWAQLMQNLSHPALTVLARTVEDTLPEPTPAILEDLKTRAGTCPRP